MAAGEIPEKTAKMVKKFFDAYMKAGFTREEAIQLCAGNKSK
jgi:hypothetical protein